MTEPAPSMPTVRLHPLTPERWPDLERLFGDRGACGGCWCMYWRVPAGEYEAGKGDQNRRKLRQRTEGGPRPPGILAYIDGESAAWCAVGPRSEFVRFQRSRILAPVDDESAWSIVCFFVEKRFRRMGLTPMLIHGACDFAAHHGATIVEGYPVDKDSAVPTFAFTGLASAFRQAGFDEVVRRSATRPVMRRRL